MYNILLEDYLEFLYEKDNLAMRVAKKDVSIHNRIFGSPFKMRRHHRKNKWKECEMQYKKNPSPELRKKCDILKNNYYKIGMAAQRKKYDPNLKK